MSKIVNLDRYKASKKLLPIYEDYLIKLGQFSDYLFNNLHLPGAFAILGELEVHKVSTEIEIGIMKHYINSNEEPKIILIRKKDDQGT